MLVVDAANVVGSRPTGWWRDRAGAAGNLGRELATALRDGSLQKPVVLVVEGAARAGVAEGDEDGLRVVHAGGHGDDAIVQAAAAGLGGGERVTVVTADRELRGRVQQIGADVVSPGWLFAKL
jgi:hypothetical protein